MKILIIQTAFLGDVVLATSLVQQTSDKYPDAKVDVLVRDGAQTLLANHPLIQEVLIWEKSREKYRNLLRLSSEIRARGYDQVINVQRFAATGSLTWRSRAGVRAGFDKNPFSAFFSRKVKHLIPHESPEGPAGFLHEIQRNARLLGPELKFTPPSLFPSAEDQALAKRICRDKPIVVVAPGSVWYTKRWPEQKWRELIALIPAWLRVVLVGGPDDAELGEKLCSAREDVHNLCGQRSLMQSIALMKEAVRIFANDSGPAHMAAAVGAPVTAVFLATRPDFGFSPPAADLHLVMAEEECCSTGLHGSERCRAGDFHCAMAIEPKDVIGPEFALWEAASLLREGGLLLHDTDTIPGLAARADDSHAVQRIYDLKGREAGKPLLMLCEDVDMITRYVDVPEQVRAVWEWSTAVPVTIVLPGAKTGKGGLAGNLLAPDGSIGVRIPARARVRSLIRTVGVPIASTSANKAGKATAPDLDSVSKPISEGVDLVLPVTPYPQPGLPTDYDWNLPPAYQARVNESTSVSSTILKWNGNGFTVLREGAGYPDIEHLLK